MPLSNQASPEPRFPVIAQDGSVHEYRCKELTTNQLDTLVGDPLDGVYGYKHWGSSDTGTRMHWDNWSCRDNDCQVTSPSDIGRSQYRLYYHRESETQANGGRCQTQMKTLLGHNGTWSARLYIHTNVEESTGVYTIGIFDDAGSALHEIDLVVANLYQTDKQDVDQDVIQLRSSN